MPLETWATQPAKPFDSFYYYHTEILAFVRIRLELGRTGERPDPGVFAKENRYVGFVDSTNGFDFKDYDRWSVNANKEIVYRVDEFNSIVLSRQQEAGKKVIDFTLEPKKAHPEFVHHGNRVVVEKFRLPVNSHGQPVTPGMLKTIAKWVLARTMTIDLCPSTSTPAELADAIFKLYQEAIQVPA